MDPSRPAASPLRRPGHARQWEDNAGLDPLWAILTREGGAWTETEFFATGEEEIARLFAFMGAAGFAPAGPVPFLDFGCGVGRVTLPIAARLGPGVGVDVSERMVELARSYSASRAPGVRFVVNRTTDLSVLGPARFGFLYSHLVLHHLTPRDQLAYLDALLAALAPGGVAALQTIEPRSGGRRPALRELVPTRVRRLARRAVAELRGASPPPDRPVVSMHTLAEDRVLGIVAVHDCQILAAPYSNSAEPDHRGRLEFFEPEEATRRAGGMPFLARFYFVRRRAS
jgi:SAM-dependent methyltransferase